MNAPLDEPAAAVDFDQLASNEEIWTLTHPSGQFALAFSNTDLFLIHDETEDAGGMSFARALDDDALDRLISVLTQYRNWRA